MIDCIITLFCSHTRMNNAILSCLPSHSYTNNVISGCNEALMDNASQMSSNLIVYDSSLCLYGNFSNDYSQFGVQHTMNTQSPCSTIISSGSTSIMPKQNLKDPSPGDTHLYFMPAQEGIFYHPWKSNSVQQSNNEPHLTENARKRSVETCETSTCGFINSATNEGTEEKRRPTRFQEKLLKIQKEKAPTVRRRSQKLTDKITTLQKLVSPYGKTDTASVLLEASLSIKALQDHIEDSFHMISRQQMIDVTGEAGSELQSRGLCLVPCVTLEEFDRRFSTHYPLQ